MANYPSSQNTDDNLYLAVNNLSTALNGAITAGDTTINVADASNFPSVGILTIDLEAIHYTGKTATSFTGCTRGFDGTTAAVHSDGSTVFHDIPAAHHNVLKDEIKAVTDDLRDGFTADLDDSVAPATTATDNKERLDQIVTQVKNITGETDWKTVPSETLNSLESAKVEKAGDTMTGALLMPTGTVGAPSLSFSSSTNTGLAYGGGNTFYATANGTQAMIWNSTSIRPLLPMYGAGGSASAPEYSFFSDPDTGMYSFGANIIGFATNGTLRFNISDTSISLQDSSMQILGKAGSASAPSYSFNEAGRTDDGMYSSGASTLDWATGGTQKMSLSSNGRLSVINGTTGGYSFLNDTDNYFALTAADTWNFYAGGTQTLQIGKNTTTFIGIPDGTASQPALLFNTDADTGIYKPSSNEWAVACGGAEKFRINTANSANDIRMAVYDQTAGGMVQVTRGAADSGGSGYRVLRVPN